MSAPDRRPDSNLDTRIGGQVPGYGAPVMHPESMEPPEIVQVNTVTTTLRCPDCLTLVEFTEGQKGACRCGHSRITISPAWGRP